MIAPIFACLIGCGPQLIVSVTANATPQAQADTRFSMAPADTHVRAANPDYQALAKAVARALETKGFGESKTAGEGNLVVLIDWSVSDPRVVARHAGGDIGSPAVTGAAPGTKGMPVGGTNNYGSFGFGAEVQNRPEVEYDRTVTVKAYDAAALKADPKAKAVWDVTLTSTGDTDDVPKFAAPMIAAAMPYMTQTAPRTRVRLGFTDAPVKYVSGEIAALPQASASR